MSITKHKIDRVISEFRDKKTIESLIKMSKTKPETVDSVPPTEPYTANGADIRMDFLEEKTGKKLETLNLGSFSSFEKLEGNIENFIGMTQVPTGVAGPIAINGTSAKGLYYVPLATTEGALIASYSRGMRACREAGWITSICLIEGVQRSPFFKFNDFIELGEFIMWVMDQKNRFQYIVGKRSRFAKLNDLKMNIEGNSVILTLEYTTGDAAGQNMVTLCTHDICSFIIEECPIKPQHWFIESNYSGDKKATALSFSGVRGKKVSAEIVIPEKIVHSILKARPEKMVEYWKSSTLAVIESGSIGAQGHVANGLTALFMACGQDVACISEASVGITRMELVDSKDLYVSVTLPNLIVGTVGGGTGLPTQKECLELLDCYGEGGSKKFAEICAAVSLAGELSIAAAISEGHFAQAHEMLGRKKAQNNV